MKILMTQREMERYGGSELYTAEVARALVARGHEVALYCPKPGRISKLIQPSGIVVETDLRRLPFEPDVIHAHHHLPTMAALAHFAHTPAIYVWHGARPWVEQPPDHPRIIRYIVTSERLGPLLTAEQRIAPERIRVVPNFVDPLRYSHVRDVADRPRHAVLYGHGGFHPAELDTLEEICNLNGLKLQKIGYPYNNPRPRPEYFLPDFDIAFAIGRCAIEAMASGCAVVPIVPQLAGQRITMQNFDTWRSANFSPRYYTSSDRFDAKWMRDTIAAWDPDDIANVTRHVRDTHGLDQAMAAFEACYQEAILAPKQAPDEAGFAPYLAGMANQADQIWRENTDYRAETTRLHAEIAELKASNAQHGQRLQLVSNMLVSAIGADLTQPQGWSRADVTQRIKASGLFDADWYLNTYSDVAEQNADPLTHYLDHGAFEGRNPSADFDGASYFAANPHLKGMGLSPLEHFLRQIAVHANPDTHSPNTQPPADGQTH